ncbi:MAG: tRNA (adenosine(37)-N6)-threonylcarbamoyltransferase complex dimerization subunit type 1 TsaB [Pseudobdellovibrio sp.]|nr:tRNA (adenosine(37)-N6)-threonylcarbamoyltransferase complex dimerization subunit type 1 TsaB [Pseudobdellovibrio sp.]
MIILSCETSTLLGSVAIHKDGQLLSQKSLFRQGSHAEALNVLIQDCLTEAKISLKDVDHFATGLGPGSFTGIRISFNTVKTFSEIFNKDMAGIDSLKSLAYLNQDLALSLNQTEIACALNAFKNMVYIATYKIENNSLVETRPPQVVRVQELNSFIVKPILFVGDAISAYENYLTKNCPDKLIRHSSVHDYPTAVAVGHLAGLENNFFHWSKLLPLYLRASEAEENLNGIKYQPL